MPLLGEVREEMRKEFKCMLVANPKNLTVDDFEREYERLTGKRLDISRFKTNLKDFIRSMPDSFKLERVIFLLTLNICFNATIFSFLCSNH